MCNRKGMEVRGAKRAFIVCPERCSALHLCQAFTHSMGTHRFRIHITKQHKLGGKMVKRTQIPSILSEKKSY